MLDGLVGAVIGRLEPAVGSMLGIGLMMEAAVGERSAQTFVKEQEEQRDLTPFGGEAVGVAGAVTLQEGMTLELAQIVAQLVQAIASLREAEGGEDGLMDLLGRPATDVSATVQEDFHQPDDAGLVDLDAGIAHRADGDRQGDALQERKVDVNVEPLRLEGGETAGDGLEFLPDRFEIVQALLETEVLEVVGAQLVAQERRELLVLLQEGVLEVGAKDMMAMLDLVDDGGELAGDPCDVVAARRSSEILWAVSRHSPSSQLRSNSLWIGKLRLKMKLRQYSICEIE